MCECSSRLVLWIDQELPVEEAAAVSKHVEDCRDCFEQAERFRTVSRLFSEQVHISPLRPVRAVRPAWSLVPAAIAAGVVMALVLPARHPVTTQGGSSPALLSGSAFAPRAVEVAVPVPVTPQAVRHTRRARTAWQPVPPTVQIMIPADALYPPGAVPDGFDFVADLSLSPDGTAAGLALRP